MTPLEITLIGLCAFLWLAGGDLLWRSSILYRAVMRRRGATTPRVLIVLIWPIVWIYATLARR